MSQTTDVTNYTLFTKRIGLVGIAKVVVSIKGLIILPILTKNLGPSDYGIWALILVTVSLLQPFILLGLDSSILRFLSSKGKKEVFQGIITTFFVIVFMSIVAILIIFFASNFLASNLLKEESTAYIIIIASPLILLQTLNTLFIGSFRIFGQIKRYAMILFLETFLEIILITFFIFSGYGLKGAIFAILISRTITLIIMLFLVISYAGFFCTKFYITQTLFKI